MKKRRTKKQEHLWQRKGGIPLDGSQGIRAYQKFAGLRYAGPMMTPRLVQSVPKRLLLRKLVQEPNGRLPDNGSYARHRSDVDLNFPCCCHLEQRSSHTKGLLVPDHLHCEKLFDVKMVKGSGLWSQPKQGCRKDKVCKLLLSSS